MKTIGDIISSFPSQGDKPALRYKTGFRTFSTTYLELHHQILQACVLLDQLGLKQGDQLILWGFNSPNWGIIFLAAARSGIVIVPIDYLATAEYVAKIQKLVNSKLLIHSEYKLPSKIDVKTLVLDRLLSQIQDLDPALANNPTIASSDLLEIVYTSGTTGDPKGVLLTHGNLIANIQAIKQTIQVRPDQTFLSLLPLSHLFEQNPGFLTPLSAGCTIIYMKGLRPKLIFKTLAEEHVTNIVIVPRLLQLLADGITREVEKHGKTKIFNRLAQIKAPAWGKKILFRKVWQRFGTHFEYFICGGAPLGDDLESFWHNLGFRVIQGYGLTESAPVLTANPLDTVVTGSVGKALPGVELKFGPDGEIYARGGNITSGYYLDSDKTTTLFEDGWMKTGDIGGVDSNGYVYLKGRKKDVIVTSAGLNIYPEDIEAILSKQPGVKAICVVALPSKQGEQIHAEVILSNNQANLKQIIDSTNLQLNENQRITSSGIWHQDDFPRTTTMKIKKPLVIEKLTDSPNASATPPLNPQTKLYHLISQVCQTQPHLIRPQARLALDLNLTSVGRVELITALEQEFNIDLVEEDIKANTTVSELEALIKNRQTGKDSTTFRRWLLSPVPKIIRASFNLIIADNVIRLFCRRQVIGRHNLNNLDQPVIFISNHIGYFDAPNVLMSLPWNVRQNIAVATWKEYFLNAGDPLFKSQSLNHLLWRLYDYYTALMVNSYPLPKQTGFKRSLEYTGELLDSGWNVLFFPEGEHSPSGQLQSFKNGIGWMVKELQVPVVPIKHMGLEKIMAGDKHQLPHFGKVTIKIGPAAKIDPDLSIPEITRAVQKLLKDL